MRQQHEERNVGFLVDEIKVMDIFEAKNRVFFISAKEVLAKRSHDERGTPIGEKNTSWSVLHIVIFRTCNSVET